MVVKERPILMHARSIRGILEGRKTQTRRIIKIDPSARFVQQTCDCTAEFDLGGKVQRVKNRYGVKDDRLWVRETWAYFETPPRNQYAVYRDGTARRYDGHTANGRWSVDKWKSPIHMPRWASRLTLNIVNIRVARVQEISERDARAEGSYLNRCDCAEMNRKPRTPIEALFRQTGCHIHGDEFKYLWDDTNGKGAWERNDWVFIITFRKLAPEKGVSF